MLPMYRYSTLSKNILTKQVKMLNNIYGAACDHQYMLNTMPQLSKRMTIIRRLSDVQKERQKDNLGHFKDHGDGQGICEECGGPMHLPKAPSKNKQKDTGKVPNKIPGVGAEIKRKPEADPPNIFENWRDPLTTRVQLMNPPDEEIGIYRGLNVAMI